MMDILVENVIGNEQITIITPYGSLDASTDQILCQKVMQLKDSGAQYLLLDLANIPFMSSAGLVALFNIARLYQGNEPIVPDERKTALESISKTYGTKLHNHIKLLNPKPYIAELLEVVGFKKIFEIYADREQAIASFQE